MGRSGFGTIRRAHSGRYQARVACPRTSAGDRHIRHPTRGCKGARTISRATTTHAQLFTPTRVVRLSESSRSCGGRRERVIDRRQGCVIARRSIATCCHFFVTRSSVGDEPRRRTAVDREVVTEACPSTVRRTYVVLDQLLAVAVERGIITTSPANGVQLPRIVRIEARFLTPASWSPWRRPLILAIKRWCWLWLGNTPIGEASGLRRSDVNLQAGTIRVENNAVKVLGRAIEGPPKTKAGRRSMTLPPSVVDDLRSHLEVNPVPSTSSGQAASDRFWRTTGDASLGVRSARHGTEPASAARLEAHRGRVARARGCRSLGDFRRAGHSSVAFTYDRYGHLFPEIDKQAAGKLEQVRREASAPSQLR